MVKSTPHQQILEHLRSQIASGKSVKDYCKEHHIGRTVFYGWRKMYATELSVTASNLIHPVVITNTTDTSNTSTPPQYTTSALTDLSVTIKFTSGVEATTVLSLTQLATLINHNTSCSR